MYLFFFCLFISINILCILVLYQLNKSLPIHLLRLHTPLDNPVQRTLCAVCRRHSTNERSQSRAATAEAAVHRTKKELKTKANKNP